MQKLKKDNNSSKKKSKNDSNRFSLMKLSPGQGPANHNTLSQSSMIKMFKNPRVLNAFKPKSYFAYFIDRALKNDAKKGGKKVESLSGTNKCDIRGDLDDCLLRRRVVFAATPYDEQGIGNRAAQKTISGVNHGRMHRLKSLPSHGNTKTAGTPQVAPKRDETFQNKKQVKNYLNAMKNTTVRNSELFKRNVNKLWQLQKGPGRTAVKYDEKANKLVKFNPAANMKENPHILWTTFGLHLDQKQDGKTYEFFDFINYIYDKYNKNNTKFNETKYTRPRGKMGMNYIIQLDSATLTYLHEEFYFKDTLDKDYMPEIKKMLSSCMR
jgi:hypothetical protein